MKDQALYDRLVARVRVDEATACWIWTGPYWKNRPWPQNRYGYIGIWGGPGSIRSKTVGTHRAMLLAIHGPLTPQQCACHRCDVPLCINPAHLFIGSMRDNILDSRSKNRHHEAKKNYCDRGHPLFGENVRIGKQVKGKLGIRRTCKTCETGRRRMDVGWPEHLAYNMSIKVPGGYRIDPVTGKFMPTKVRLSLSATETP